MKKVILLLFILKVCFQSVSAQKAEGELTYETFLGYVKQYHPITVQAGTVAKIGKLEILKARGSFDPLATSEIKQKYFDGTTYYDLNQHQLKVPTWFGMEGRVGLEDNSGDFLNPENNSKSGLWYAGISFPLAQGLVIDRRRAMLKQAKEFRLMSEAEQQLLINDLLLEASYAYWKWYVAYREIGIYEEGLKLADERLEATRKWAIAGDRPIIDTLEANIQMQNRLISYTQAQLNFATTSLELSTFLWWENSIPLELAETALPQQQIPDINNLLSAMGVGIDSLNANHPLIIQQQKQRAILAVERQLKAEMLKPQLNINYTPLSNAVGDNPLAQYSINNYTWGLNFSFPVFLRKERAELQQTKLKITAIEQKTAQKSYELLNKAKVSLAEVENFQRQIGLYTTNVESYRQLLNAELQKLSIGESSLFLVNQREQSYLDAQMKLAELVAKQQQALAGYKWAVAKW